LIFSPGEAQPHIFIGASLCKIMLSLTNRGSLTCDIAGLARTTKPQASRGKNTFGLNFISDDSMDDETISLLR